MTASRHPDGCRGGLALAAVLLGWACSGPNEQPRPAPAQAAAGAEVAARPSSPSPPVAAAEPPPAPPPCPDDMVFVDAVHCPDGVGHQVGLRCLREEHEPANRLTICHRFAPGQRCPVAPRRQRFCIDRYEYPSVEGAHPPVMVSAYDAAALCAEKGKRLCWESEWTAACEGPELLPFPYGHARDSTRCNIDNRYVEPRLSKVHSPRPEERDPELARLDQSVPSGSKAGCKSGFGVHDLTGNFDEWVLSEWKRGRSRWAALKGGAWGHVRNACRPVTTSHAPEWSYYFVSFRCCKEPDAAATPPVPADGVTLWEPPPAPSLEKRAVSRGWPRPLKD